jgi:rhamnogalacturonan endolyase
VYRSARLKFSMSSLLVRFLSGALLCVCATAQAQNQNLNAAAHPQVEKLDRGLVALVQDGKPFISWRLFPGEEATGFNLYRTSGNAATVRLNPTPLLGATNFIDATADLTRENRYFVRALSGRREASPSAAFLLKADAAALPCLPIRLQTPAGYAPNDLSTADLDGDGQLDFVLHQVGRAKDNSQNGETDPPILQGYRLDGTLLWTINLGKNIRDGAHYTQFMVYDLDGDGRAEVMCKTADGTVDGQNKAIGDPNANHVNGSGRILSGPEYLSVFDGRTGAALATTNYLPRRHPDTDNPTGDQLKAVWGDGYGNRNDRFLACIAYLDGIHPSVVMCRGYYTRTVLAAWDFRAGKLTSRWVFDTMTPGNEKFAGQGNHNLSVGDVDGDGKDEIVYGKMAVDDDGKGIYSTGIGHGDAMHLSDLDPSRPGLEVFSIQESFGDAGLNFFDAKTGEVLWKKASIKAGADGEGPARGLALDIDPRTPGAECWGAGAGMNGKLFSCKGNQIGESTPSCNMGIYWDGDPLSELLDGTTVSKWDWQKGAVTPLLAANDFGCVSNNGTKANPALVADILGDWREEVVYRSADNQELRVFVSTVPTAYRLPTLMSDHVYRMGIAWQNVAYNQPPHLGYDLVSRLKWSAP